MKAILIVVMSCFGLLTGCCSTYGLQGSVDCGGSSSCYTYNSCSSCSSSYYPSYTSSSCSSCSHRYGNTQSYCGRWGDPTACETAYYGNIGGDQSHANWI